MKPEFHFAFSRHEPEFAADIANAVASCEVIAFEYPNVTSRAQLRYGGIYSAYAQLPSSIRQATYDRVDPQGDNWVLNTIRELSHEGQHVALLDITTDHPDYRYIRTAHLAYDMVKKGLSSSMPVERLRTLYRSYLQTTATANHLREKLVARQLLNLAPHVGSAAVGVVCGAVHTAIRHQIAAKGYATTAQFIGVNQPACLSPGKKAQFPYAMQAIRQLHLTSEFSPDEACINRIILSDMFRFTSLFLPSHQTATAIDIATADELIETKIISRLSDSQVAQTLSDIDRYRTTPQTPNALYASITQLLTALAQDCRAI